MSHDISPSSMNDVIYVAKTKCATILVLSNPFFMIIKKTKKSYYYDVIIHRPTLGLPPSSFMKMKI